MSLGRPSTLTLVDREDLKRFGTREGLIFLETLTGALAGPAPGLARLLLICFEAFLGPVLLLFLLACLVEPIISSKD